MTETGGGLLTDLYQLTMAQAYLREGLTGEAVFELFVRSLPDSRNFLLAAGLEQALDYLENLRFSSEDLDWARRCGLFDKTTLDWLSGFRFAGNVHAVPEGTAVFGQEPLLRVTAPLPQAQLVETRLLNIVNLQTSVASKAARCLLAAPGRNLVEFGLRRAHGAEAGLWGARAAYLAGFSATSNVLAAARYGIPASGTMAHSFIQAHEREAEAFESFARSNPGSVVLLLDTYDVDRAAEAAAGLGRRLAAEGRPGLRGVRLDSGDLAAQARRVRAILDAAGLPMASIFASGNLDERSVHDLVAQGAPIDGFGIGSRLATSADLPFLDCAYKLQEYAGRPRRKRSEGKATWPGRKQVWRTFKNGRLAGDVVGLETETFPGEPLLVPVMRAGRRLPGPALSEIRSRAAKQLESLPAERRTLDPVPDYPVEISAAVRALAEQADLEGNR